jgi:3-phosphoshikimate 1-carboxyvinyltransferase
MEIKKVSARQAARPIHSRPPGSKSLTNRLLVMAGLCAADVTLEGALTSEDTQMASGALEKLGLRIDRQDDRWTIQGSLLESQARREEPVEIFLGNSGTSTRFLSAVLCALGLNVRVDGTERMRERPIGLLIKALTDLGGVIESEKGNDCPPLKIGGDGNRLRGGKTELSGEVSSQYFSGLMLAAPLAKGSVQLRVTDQFLSRPYIEMTAALMERFQVQARVGDFEIEIPANQTYQSPGTITVEPDATSASYPLVLGMLHGQSVTIEGVDQSSVQGELEILDHLQTMGARVEWGQGRLTLRPPATRYPLGEVDLNRLPDAAMTLLTLAAVTPGEHKLTGLRNLAVKECDRLTALETELQKMGAHVEAHSDGFTVWGIPSANLHPARLATYKDHRMAMCLALLGTICPGTRIEDPRCVEKTYPRFWGDLESWLGPQPAANLPSSA